MKTVSHLLIGAGMVLTVTSVLDAATVPMKHKLLMTDIGTSKLNYINLANPTEKWSADVYARDLQLIGNDQVMVSSCNMQGTQGWSIFNVKTGAFVTTVAVAGAPAEGIESAFRLAPNEVYAGASGYPAKIMKVDSTGKNIRNFTLSSINDYLRIVRPTAAHTFLIGTMSEGPLYECDTTGKVVWQADSAGTPYMAVRLPNGNTVVSTGYSPTPQIRVFDSKGKLLRAFPKFAAGDTLKTKIKPVFFAGFQILRNGNIVATNFPGDDGGNEGVQILEFDSLGTLVSYWKQDPNLIPCLRIHGVIVLDDLDTKVLNSDVNGVLGPLGPVSSTEGPRWRVVDHAGSAANARGIFDIRGAIRPPACGQSSPAVLVHDKGVADASWQRWCAIPQHDQGH